MAGAHPRAAWLDAMGVDRWVPRNLSADADEPRTADSAVAWQGAVDSPVLTVLTCRALDDASSAVFDRMLAAIRIARSDCAIGIVDTPGTLTPCDTPALLILAQSDEEPIWHDAAAGRSTHVDVIAHPERFSSDPAAKRPAWEALKRLERTLNAG